MSQTTLFTIACEMLRKTNPYKKDVSELKCRIDGEENSLLDLLSNETSKKRSGKRSCSEKNFLEAYNAIGRAMVTLVEYLNASFSFKQSTKEKLSFWLDSIQKEYDLGEREIPEGLEIRPNERDTGIVMLKALHAREGVTKEKLRSILKLKEPRSVQKNLRKLSPELYEGESMGQEYDPFRIGGQPIRVNVVSKSREKGQKYYHTPNTIHPIILLENLLQVEELLKALGLSREQYGGGISTYIAFDIWSQLSDYAKDKLRRRSEYEAEIYRDFIDEIDQDCPGDHISAFHTQREMLDLIDATPADFLRDAEKIPNRKCNLRYKDEKGNRIRLQNIRIERRSQSDYVAIDDAGKEYFFKEEWVDDISIE